MNRIEPMATPDKIRILAADLSLRCPGFAGTGRSCNSDYMSVSRILMYFSYNYFCFIRLIFYCSY